MFDTALSQTMPADVPKITFLEKSSKTWLVIRFFL